MALKKAGVSLVAENYSQYKKTMQDINRMHREAFSTAPIQQYNRETSRLAQVTKSQVNKSLETTKQMTDNLRDSFNGAGTAGRRFGGSLPSGILDKFGGIANKAGGALNGLLQSGFAKAAAKATAFGFAIKAALDLTQFITGADDLAAKVETLDVTLRVMADHQGYTAEQTDLALTALKQQGITTQASYNSLIKMTRANIEWSEASKLAAIAQSSAVSSGMNSSAAFQRLITGIQKMEPELLDELGITLQRSIAYDKLADSLGVSAQKLTQQQKQQAILNEIYEQSEGVLKVYDKALETAGKREGSLARVLEETKLNVGNVLLPLKELSIEWKENYYKGLQKATTGMKSWESVTRGGVEALKSLAAAQIQFLTVGQLQTDSFDFWDSMGEAIFNFGKMGTFMIIQLRTGFSEMFQRVGEQAGKFGEVLTQLWNRNRAGFWEAMDEMGNISDGFTKDWKDRQKEMLDDAIGKNPDLLKGWDELTATVEIAKDAFDRGGDAMEDMAEDTEALEKALEAQVEAFEKLEKIQTKFESGIKKLGDSSRKDFEKAAKDAGKKREKIAQKRDKALIKLEDSNSKKREKITKDHNKRVAEDQKKLFKDLARERERFELSQMQSSRRFQVADRRLQAEGDVLGLMQLREDFELSQKEAAENFQLDQKGQTVVAQDTAQVQQEELAQKLADLDTSIKDRRAEIQNGYQEEITDLNTANAERMAALKENYKERYDALVASRDKEIEELGKSLNKEAEITEEGMQTIASKIAEVFGSDQAGDALIKGWTERTTTAFGEMVGAAEEELKALEGALEDVTKKLPGPSRTGGNRAGFGATPNTLSRPRGMRQGGMGVVTGPAAFEVEPGVKEFVAFAPLPQTASLDVNMAGGFNIEGGQQAGGDAVQAALDQMVDEFGIAVNKLAKRRL